MRRRKGAAALAAVATLFGAGTLGTMRSDAATVAPEPARATRSVTLPTGDRITLGDDARVEVERAPGRERATFLTQWDHGDLRVVPTDATALLADGRADPRLFDVSRLLREGDDPPLRVGDKTDQRVRPQARAALWKDLVGGRVASVRLDETDHPALAEPADTVGVTLRFIGRDGRPATTNLGYLQQLDGSGYGFVYDADGEATVQVPPGTYLVSSFIPAGADQFAGTMLAQPRLVVTGPRTVVLDARLGRPVSIGVPERGAVPVQVGIGFSEKTPDGTSAGGELVGDTPDGQYTAQIGAGASEFTSWLTAGFRATVGGDSPYAYHLAYYNRGRMWTGLDRHPTRAQLAAVRTTVARTVAGSTGRAWAYHELEGVGYGIRWPQLGAAGGLPRVATEYFNADAGVRWELNADENLGAGENEVGLQAFTAPPMTYRPGRVYRTDWNRAALGPGLPARSFPELWLTRTGDRILICPSWLDDGAGHDGRGDPFTTAFTITLDQDSRASSCETFTVPAGTDRHRVAFSAVRAAPAELSTRVETAWTFDSGHVYGAAPQPLAVHAVRFAPPVDDRNAAVAGRDLAVPVTVTAQPGSAAAPVVALAVQVSYDDGATWSEAPVRRTAAGGIALLHQPATPGFVSLRATAADGTGNSVTQTIVRAYRLVAG